MQIEQTSLIHLEQPIINLVQEARVAQSNVSSISVGKKAVAEVVGQRTLSGWTKRSGYQLKMNEVIERSKSIHYSLRKNPLLDQGVDGRYNASHAEKQAYEIAPNQPIGVSRLMCLDCKEYFRHLAQYVEKLQVIADPDVTRVFYPDGQIAIIHADDSVVFYSPDMPVR